MRCIIAIKKNVNKNANDPRVARSVRDIRNAMLELIAEKPFGKIQAEEIIERTTVNFKTFYRYYSSKSDVLEEIRESVLESLSDGLKTDAKKLLSYVEVNDGNVYSVDHFVILIGRGQDGTFYHISNP